MAEISAQKQDVARLKTVADQHPFYKYNGLWSRELQNLVRRWFMSMSVLPANILIKDQVSSIELCAWLGGLPEYKTSSASFMTIEDVGKFLESMTVLSLMLLQHGIG